MNNMRLSKNLEPMNNVKKARALVRMAAKSTMNLYEMRCYWKGMVDVLSMDRENAKYGYDYINTYTRKHRAYLHK